MRPLEDLLDLYPVKANGERLPFPIIIRRDFLEEWKRTRAAAWLAEGYVTVDVYDRVPTIAFGDKRRWGWLCAGDGQ